MQKEFENNLMDSFKNKCKEHHLKITPQRTAIYKELIKKETHPSADQIFSNVQAVIPNISFDTVYRTLMSFSKAGIINLVTGYGEPKRFDSNVNAHHHFRCIKCFNMTDFYSDACDKVEIPSKIKKQFKVLKKQMILEGICNQCNNQLIGR
ncbi:hypothetical protein MNBD_UNCLBAC01-333 [hydrothermal vent metagenome]|uniref:Peroxide stress regulator PerR, FUR family n=1 Tax=hydrothermal vent metagenome TaxID=652676 RepID=A0A3B1DV46_9ZZZZ